MLPGLDPTASRTRCFGNEFRLPRRTSSANTTLRREFAQPRTPLIASSGVTAFYLETSAPEEYSGAMLASVRARLTLWHVGVLALLLVAFSMGLYVLLRENFYERADGILKSVCSATVSILSKELSESGLDELAARDAVKTLNLPEHTLTVLDAQGELLAEKPVGSGARIVFPDSKSLQDGAVHLVTARLPGGELRRVAAIRVTLDPVGPHLYSCDQPVADAAVGRARGRPPDPGHRGSVRIAAGSHRRLVPGPEKSGARVDHVRTGLAHRRPESGSAPDGGQSGRRDSARSSPAPSTICWRA